MPTRYFTLQNIRRGKGARRKYVYAELYEIISGCGHCDEDSIGRHKELAISATLDYILLRIHDGELNVPNLAKALAEAYPIITGRK